MTVKAAIPTNKAVTRLMCASLVPSLCYDITDYVMAKEIRHSCARFGSEIDLIGASQNASVRAKADACAAIRHAGDNTAARMRSNRGCDPKRPVHGTDWREEQRRSVLNPLACARTYYIFLNARQKHLMLCLAATITVDEGHGATETP
jgi:hypothetical protein